MSNKHTDKSPFVSEFSSKLRESWSLPIDVTHPVQRLREISPFHVRLKSAVQVITQGPMLAGHGHCRAVMWDATTFNGHEVAAEAANLLADTILMAYSHLRDEEKARLDIYSFCRKAHFEEHNGKPLTVVASDFLGAFPHGELLNNSGAVIYDCATEDVRFYVCTTTKALLGIAVPFSCTMDDFVAQAKALCHHDQLVQDYLQISAYLYRNTGDAA
jgi:hypothetical protein